MSDKIRICSVGDLMICDSPLYASVGVGSNYEKIKGNLFNNCKELFKKADVVIGNFETVVYEPKNKSLKETQMCCQQVVVEELHDAGVSILSIANNHCMQHGVDGFNNTKVICEQFGIQPIGIRDEEPYIKVINNTPIAFLSLCIHIEWYEPDRVLYENRIEIILRKIRELRTSNKNILIVVSVHWGDEFAQIPSNAQVALAHKIIDIGANVILGHHSHIYQGIEQYNDGIIVYGQGNFISDMIPEACRQTGIVMIEFDKEQKGDYEFVPYIIGRDYIPVKSNDQWFPKRQIELMNTVQGRITDDDYWTKISKNHAKAHNEFKRYFIYNITKYKLRISLRMISAFIVRKIKRKIGTSADGRVSSMDPTIMNAIEKYELNDIN